MLHPGGNKWFSLVSIHSNRSFLKIMATANIFLNNRLMHDLKDATVRRQSTSKSVRQKCSTKASLWDFCNNIANTTFFQCS